MSVIVLLMLCVRCMVSESDLPNCVKPIIVIVIVVSRRNAHTAVKSGGMTGAHMCGRIKREWRDGYMSKEEVFVKLNEVFRDVFDDESITVTETTTADDIEEWDSLEHINLLAAVEQEFGMKFNMGQVVSMKNVGEMADIIISQIG